MTAETSCPTRRKLLSGVIALSLPVPAKTSGLDPGAALAREWLTLHEQTDLAWRNHRALLRRGHRSLKGPKAEARQAAWEEANHLTNLLYQLTVTIEATPATTLSGAILRAEVGLKFAIFEEHTAEEDLLESYRILRSAIDELKAIAKLA